MTYVGVARRVVSSASARHIPAAGCHPISSGRDGGWVEVARIKGSHHQLTHPSKKGIVTVKHPAKDYPIKTLRSIEKQSGVSLR